jgi:hypothetical protein
MRKMSRTVLWKQLSMKAAATDELFEGASMGEDNCEGSNIPVDMQDGSRFQRINFERTTLCRSCDNGATWYLCI